MVATVLWRGERREGDLILGFGGVLGVGIGSMDLDWICMG